MGILDNNITGDYYRGFLRSALIVALKELDGNFFDVIFINVE